MRLQSTQANCGPACLRNALLCHGITRSETELESLAGTTGTAGTSPAGLVKAIRAIALEHPGLSPGIIREARPDVAILRLLACLNAGHVCIICADDDEHWVLAFGTLGGGARIVVHVSDPADYEMVLHYQPDQLLARWRGGGRYPFVGVTV